MVCIIFLDDKTDAFNRRRGITDEEIGTQLKNKYKIQMKYYQNTLQTILIKKLKVIYTSSNLVHCNCSILIFKRIKNNFD